MDNYFLEINGVYESTNSDSTTPDPPAPKPSPPPTAVSNRFLEINGVNPDSNSQVESTPPTIAELNANVRDSVGPGNFSDGRNLSAVSALQDGISEYIGTDNPNLYRPEVVALAQERGISYNEAVKEFNDFERRLPHLRPRILARPVNEIVADFDPGRAIDDPFGELALTHRPGHDEFNAAADSQRLREINDEVARLQDSIGFVRDIDRDAAQAMQEKIDALIVEATVIAPIDQAGLGPVVSPESAAVALNYYDGIVEGLDADDPLRRKALFQRNEAALRYADGDRDAARTIIEQLNGGMPVDYVLINSSYKRDVAALQEQEGRSPEVAERLVAMSYHNAGVDLPGTIAPFDPSKAFDENRYDFDTALQATEGERPANGDDFVAVDDFDAIVANPDRFSPDVVAAAIVYKDFLERPENAEFREQFTGKDLFESIASSPWFDQNTDSWVVNLARGSTGGAMTPAFVARLKEDGPGVLQDLSEVVEEFSIERQAQLLVTDPGQVLENGQQFASGVADWGVDISKMAIGGYALTDPIFARNLNEHFGVNVYEQTWNSFTSTGSLLINDPDAVGKSVIGWDQLMENPWRWAGNQAPDIVLEVVTLGAATPAVGGTRATTTVARVVDGADAVTDVSRVGQRVNGRIDNATISLPDGATTGRLPQLDEALLNFDAAGDPSFRPDSRVVPNDDVPSLADSSPGRQPYADDVPLSTSGDDELVSVGGAARSDNTTSPAGGHDSPRTGDDSPSTGAGGQDDSIGSTAGDSQPRDVPSNDQSTDAAGIDGVNADYDLRGADKPLPQLTAGPANTPDEFIGASSLHDLMSRIPSHAEQVPWHQLPDRATQGIKWQWTDGEGNRWRVRAHEMDPAAPSWIDESPAAPANPPAPIESPSIGDGRWELTTEANGLSQTNASSNWIYRVEVKPHSGGPWQYVDVDGQVHRPNFANENSPHYDPKVANDTHMPFYDPVARIRSGRSVDSVWNDGPFPRGRELERQALVDHGASGAVNTVSGNFGVIDDFTDGVATSVKSRDLTANRYQQIFDGDAGRFVADVQADIDNVAQYLDSPGSYLAYRRGQPGEITLRFDDVESRRLILVLEESVERYPPVHFDEVIAYLDDYAETNGVELIIDYR